MLAEFSQAFNLKMLLRALKIHLLDFTLSTGWTVQLAPQNITSIEELFIYIITGFINCSNVKQFYNLFVTNARYVG